MEVYESLVKISGVKSYVKYGEVYSEKNTEYKDQSEPVELELEPYEEPDEEIKTDVKVYHDPSKKLSKIVKKYTEQYSNQGNDPIKAAASSLANNSLGQPDGRVPQEDATPLKSGNTEVDQTKSDGIIVPLIRICEYTLDESNIESVKIESLDFLPTIELWVKDNKKYIKFLSKPGYNNQITFIILPSKDGSYRKISLDFTITDFKEYDDGTTLFYKGVYKMNEMKVRKTTSISFDRTTKTVCKICPHQTEKPEAPSTWETLHYIAAELGLGFATSRDIKTCNDNLFRNIQGNYLEEIESMINYGGLDEDYIFEGWVDFYNYLTVVNLASIFASPIKYNQLGMTVITKGHSTDNLPDQEFVTVPRVITNFEMTGSSNNAVFEFYEQFSNTDEVMDKGTSQQFTSMDLNGNNLSKTDMQIQENSIDGRHIEEYYTHNLLQVMMDMTTEIFGRNIIQQETIANNFKDKIRSQGVVITMTNPNFGLMRGMLLQVTFYEYNDANKKKILDETHNVVFDEKQQDVKINVEPSTPDSIDKNEEIKNDNRTGMLNPALSGLYYIDGVKFEYNMSNQKIVQTLQLLKKDRIANISNKHTSSKLDNVEVPGTEVDDKDYNYSDPLVDNQGYDCGLTIIYE